MASAAFPLLSASASAQEDTELPAIVVEGATLQASPVKPKKKPKSAAKSEGQPAAAAGEETGEGKSEGTSARRGHPAR